MERARWFRVAVVAVLLAGGALLLSVTVGRGTVLGRRSHAPPEGAGAFAAGVVRLIGENRYGEAWRLLHPVDRRAADLEEYVTCELRSPIPGHVRSVRIEAVRREPAVLEPGRRVGTTAVDVRIEIAGGAAPKPVIVTDTVHAVAVGGSWTWILPVERLALYRKNRCPGAGSALAPPGPSGGPGPAGEPRPAA